MTAKTKHARRNKKQKQGPRAGRSSTPQARRSSEPVRHLGIGIDTARYGHHVTFLRDKEEFAAPPLPIAESRGGYQKLQATLQQLHQRHPSAHMHVRIDAAGQYAANLEGFLRSLDHLPMTVSIGEPKRNKDYHRAHSPKRKADGSESWAMARYALVEQPRESFGNPPAFAVLRRVASRLQGQTKQSTRLTNQLHETLSAAFPELATIVNNIAAGWMLKLLEKYPTAPRIAGARLSSVKKIPFIKPETAQKVHEAAKHSVGRLSGKVAEQMIRELVSELQHSLAEEERWKELLTEAFDALPDGPHHQIASIKGIGKQTAAAIVATAVSIDRFETENHLVGYYGVFPEELQSGVDKFGRPNPPGKKIMSRKGNDLVRGLLWQCAKCASAANGGNPAVRELFLRRVAGGDTPQVAWGYCMTKLLRQVFGVWTTGKTFDPEHESKQRKKTETSGPKEQSSVGKEVTEVPASLEPVSRAPGEATPHVDDSKHPKAAKQVARAARNRRPIDYQALRDEITFDRILEYLGQPASRAQHRGPCPIHEPQATAGRLLSVNLKRNVFRCFHGSCGKQGNNLDFWSAYRKLEPYDAAVDMAKTFGIEVPYLQQPATSNNGKKPAKTGGHTPPST
jgi:transposase